MINKVKAEMYCSQPIELIENYDKAVADQTQVWHCHHIWETMLGYSANELIEMNEYYGIPACNLIFLTPEEHGRIHSEGERNPFYRKHHSDKTKEVIREKNLEWYRHNKPVNFGIPHSEETKRKMSEVKIGNNYSAKPVIQYTLDGEFVNEWKSATEAERQLGYRSRGITRCARGERKHAYKYIWKYKE